MTHLFAVSAPFADYRALFEGVAASGVRLGWLDLTAGEKTLDPVLDEALGGGAFRAARVAGGRSVAAKATRGEPVLRDLARELFKGCRAVLVRGAEGLPEIRPQGAGFEVRTLDGRSRSVDAAAFAALVRRPRIDSR